MMLRVYTGGREPLIHCRPSSRPRRSLGTGQRRFNRLANGELEPIRAEGVPTKCWIGVPEIGVSRAAWSDLGYLVFVVTE